MSKMNATARRPTPQLSIRSSYAVQRARELARMSGKTTTQVVEDALRQYEVPKTPQDQSDDERWAAIHAIMDRASKRGPFPTMKQVDDEMYDEWGLPK